MAEQTTFDIVIIGAGNAALTAALSAHEHGATVAVIEKAPREFRGGNTRFTGGVFRAAYQGVGDMGEIVPATLTPEFRDLQVGYYSESQFYDDLMDVTEGQADPKLTELLVRESLSTAKWMSALGVPFDLAGARYGAGRPNPEMRTTTAPTGTLVRVRGEGPVLSETLFRLTGEREIPVFYDTMMLDSVFTESGRIPGVRVRDGED